MSYLSIIQELPSELQPAMLALVDAVRDDIRAEARQRDGQRLDRIEATLQELLQAQKHTEQSLQELLQAQKRTEQRVGRLETVVEELAEAQKRSEQRVAELAEAQKRSEQRIAELAEAQKRTEQRLNRLEAVVAELAEAQKRTEKTVRELVQAQIRTEATLQVIQTRQGRILGRQLERVYRDKVYAYLGRLLRRVQVVSFQEIEADLERCLSDEEMDDLLLLDLLLHGRSRQHSDVQVWLAMEISAVVDRHDVERAQRRAAILRRAEYLVVPTVAGEEVTEGGADAAREGKVFLLQNGRKQFWPEALAEALSHQPEKE